MARFRLLKPPDLAIRRERLSSNDLPYEMAESLEQQSKVKGITLSQQILEALRAYLESQEDPILRADDVIFRIAGEMDSGAGDLSTNHDRYLYRKDWQEQPQGGGAG